MGIIFGKKKPASRVTDHDKAVLQLKHQRDKLKQCQKRIDLALNSDRELAKKLLNKGQKDRAKLLLKKKRYQEQILEKTDAQLENLERLTHDLEYAQVELQIIEGLKQGNEALKKINEAINISDIETILDETREGKEKQDEINALLSGNLTEEDDDAIEQELEDMIKSELPEVPAGAVDVPATTPQELATTPEKEKKEKAKNKREMVAMEA